LARPSENPQTFEKVFTLPETNSSPLKIGIPNRKYIFQPSIFRGHVSFREGIWGANFTSHFD